MRKKSKKNLPVVNLYWTEDGWMLFHQRSKRKVRGHEFRHTKRAALVLARAYGQWVVIYDRTVEIRIHDKAGKFQTAWTYPRERDPRRSRG